MMSRYKKNAVVALFGVSLGGLFLWLAVRDVDPRQLSLAAANIVVASVALSLACYWIAIVLRIARWSALLEQLGAVQAVHVAETLVIGYAVNNVLPARLGELFRADYAKRRFGMSRTTVLGSILVERLLDLCLILSCLVLGLLMTEMAGQSDPQAAFEVVALNAALLIGVVILAVYFLRSGELRSFPVPAAARRLVRDLGRGITSLNRRSMMVTAVLSVGVWSFEIIALWWMFDAVAVDLSLSQTLLVMGAASLSTLVPTAPGYIGTYQLAFVLAMGAFGYSDMHGVIASTSIQVFLFGSVTLVGISLLVARSLARLEDEA
jgi:uncharacterized membrane protein YbhN (UPF0104 family)